MTLRTLRAECAFDDCSASIIERVVLAAVDQLCAQTDIAISLLDALEFPVSEAVAELASYDITSVGVEVEEPHLHIRVHIADAATDATSFLGPVADVVTSFFEVSQPVGEQHLLLTTRLT